MSAKVAFALRGRNPDVLSCIANLSNDEVFTPPEQANRMLDMVGEAWATDHRGANLWADSSVRFLDPVTKSGIFLREITSRLTDGLATEIPDLQERVNHILTKQVYGIAITHLTSLLARRSVYCSKYANGKHSIASGFDNEAGNIWFDRLEHTWEGTNCAYCSAPQAIFDREPELENHAYAFIHTDDIRASMAELFGGNMQFDVIIGNPPYQMTGGAGGSSDSSIYHLFVEQAINLDPRYVCMVIPSRWMAGGRGLDNFRSQMLNSGHLRSLTDYQDSSEAFPGVQIKGGICHFLWDSHHNGKCTVSLIADGIENRQENRSLGEYDVYIRDERALGILKKVLAKQEPSVVDLVSGDTPFGLATNFGEWSEKTGKEKIALHVIKRTKRTIGYVERDLIRKNTEMIDVWKVFVPKAYGAGETFPHQILGREIMASPPSVCTQSYLVVAPFESELAAQSFASYYRTRFFRFLVSLRKITQDALRSTYTWVPQQTWDRDWKDEMLYKKYGITKNEINYINSMIRSMGEGDE